MTNQRIVEVDIIRAIAIYLVVFGHALCYLHQAPLTLGLIYSFHMPVLFTLSGFVTATGRLRDVEKVENWWRWRLWKSSKRLLLPYILFGTIIMPLVAVVTGHPERVAQIWTEFFITNHGLWYLPACFLLICSYVACVLIANHLPPSFLHVLHFYTANSSQDSNHHCSPSPLLSFLSLPVLSVAIAVPVAVLYLLTKCDFLRSALSYWFSFYVGVAIAHCRPRLNPSNLRIVSFVSLIVWISLAIVFAYSSHPFVGNLLKPFCGVMALAPLAFIATCLKHSKILSAVGRSTLSVYCIEGTIGYLIFPLLAPSCAALSAACALVFVFAVHFARICILE